MKPKIGIILDWQKEGSFSQFPHFALRTHYIEAVRLAGGIPWLIPYGSTNEIPNYLNNIDGLLIPGGFYAMPSHWYFNSNEHSPYQKTPRFEFEESILKEALAINMPLLCICGGMQVLGGLMGCKIIPNIKKHVQNHLEHFDLTQDHEIAIQPDSLLYKILLTTKISTNSHHNEAIISTTDKIKVSATTSDGVIEAIELPNKKFALGLQWHPEMLCFEENQLSDLNPHHLIFKEFVKISAS